MINIKIEKILQSQNKSLYWLAQKTELSYPTIHRLVNGKTTSIAFDTLNKLCTVLNCNIQDIIEYIPENINIPGSTDTKESDEINKLKRIVNNTINNTQYLPKTQDYIYKTLYSLLSKMQSYPNDDSEEKRKVLKILLKCIENLLLPENKIIELMKLI